MPDVKFKTHKNIVAGANGNYIGLFCHTEAVMEPPATLICYHNAQELSSVFVKFCSIILITYQVT